METLRHALRRAYPHISSVLTDVPWWAWMIAAAVALALTLLLVWLLVRALRGALRGIHRALRRAGRGLRDVVRAAAHGDGDARRRVRGVLANWSILTALTASLAITSVLGAVGIARVLKVHGEIAEPWNWAGVAVFQILSIILMIMVAQRAEQGLPAPGITLGFWATVAAEACFQLTHADSLVGKLLFASFSVIAGLGYHLLMHSKREGRAQELAEAAGTWAQRRMGAVRWLHPIERVRVEFLLATDEELSADEATRQVREETVVRRTARLERHAARAVWRLQRYRRAGKAKQFFSRNPQKRAQSALDAAGVARNQAMMAAVLRRVQLLSMADQLAELDYADAEGARSLTASLITPDHLSENAPPVRASVPASPSGEARPALEGAEPDTSDEPSAEPERAPALGSEKPSAPVAITVREELTEWGWSEDADLEALEPFGSGPAQLTLLTSPESDERETTVPAREAERAPDEGPSAPASTERARPITPMPDEDSTGPSESTPPAPLAGRRERALALWLEDRSLTGAALAREVGASAATGSRWRREFEREYANARARGLRVKSVKRVV